MRYVVDGNNYVKAISFGTTMEYNECVCVEYTGMVPSGWSSLEAWYFDEGDKLWRWQIIDGELTLDETAAAPKEGNWMGIAVCDPVAAATDYAGGFSLSFTLPDGTKNLAGYFVMYIGLETVDPDNSYAKCISIYTSVDENKTEIICSSMNVGSQRYGVESISMEGGFTLDGDVVNINIYNATPVIEDHVEFLEDSQYVLYPFYRR